MSDSLSWGSKLNTFAAWVKQAPVSEPKQWLSDLGNRQWAYQDEIPIVNAEIKLRRTSPSFRDLEEKAIAAKMKEAGKLRLRARSLGEKLHNV